MLGGYRLNSCLISLTFMSSLLVTVMTVVMRVIAVIREVFVMWDKLLTRRGARAAYLHKSIKMAHSAILQLSYRFKVSLPECVSYEPLQIKN